MNPEQELRKLDDQRRKVLIELKKREVKLKFEQEKQLQLEKEKEQRKQETLDKKKSVARGLGSTEMREFLHRFPYLEDKDRHPKQATDTTDLHLTSKEIMMEVSPKSYPVDEITWDEVHDIQNYWEHKTPVLGLILLIIFVFFASIFFPYYQYAMG